MDNLLIILLGALGDVVRGFSVLTPIKDQFPGTKITWLVEPKCEQIVRMHPLVDDVLVFQRPKAGANDGPLSFVVNHAVDVAKGIQTLRRELRRRSFDVVLDMQRHAKSGFFSWLTGCPRRIGFHRRNAKEGNWLFNSETIRECSDRDSKVLHYLEFVRSLGIEVPSHVEFGLEPIAGPEILPVGVLNFATHPNRTVGVVMGSTWESKNWPLSGYYDLVSSLLKDGSRTILIGDRTQAGLAETLVAKLVAGHSAEKVDGGVLNLVAQTSLQQLLSVVRLCDVCVGPDSGPGHIAAALKTPYVGIFGPTSPLRVAPFGMERFVVQAELGCMPCWRRECPGLGGLCMRLAGVHQVREKMELALAAGN